MRATTLLLTYYGCAFYGMVNPVFGILFFVHITIFRPEALVWGNLAFGNLHMCTAIITMVSYFIHRSIYESSHINSYQNKNIFILLCINLWLVIVSALAEFSVQLSFSYTTELIKIFALCFLFAKLLTTKNRLELYVWITSISFGLLSFWGFLQGLAGNARLDSLWPGGSNYIAAQFTLMAPFVLAKFFDTTLSLKYKLIFFACTLSIILCCIYTDSRGGFLGLSIGLLVFLMQIKQRVRVLAGLAVIIVLVYPWLPQDYSNRISSIFSEEQELDTSAASRPVLWKIALRIWQDYPIAGVGLGNFSPVKETYAAKVSDIVTSQEMYEAIFNRHRYPHGLYPGLLAETGLVGTSLFLILILRNIFCRFPAQFIKSASHLSLALQVRGAQAGLVGFAVAAFFGDFYLLEMLYLQLFFVGAVRGYADSLSDGDHAKQTRRVDKKRIAATH